jgi:DNA replication and repair protein RecF
LSYEKGLRQRNRLLIRIREEGVSRSHLVFWDRLLIKNGNYISKMREDFLEYANKREGFLGREFSLEYDRSVISEGRLSQYSREEVLAGTTLVGPHRDDFCVTFKKNKKFRELDRYGSRGEQRMGVLWIKLSEASYIEEKTGEKPTLLLDDVFSELDEQNREVVWKLSEGRQTIITTAEPEFLEGVENVEILKI